MSKRTTSELIELAFTFIILSSFLGIKKTLNIIKQILSMFNSILVSFYDTTILNVIFKYFITFPLVGVILMMLGSPRGKEGHWIGKILYFIVGYGIGFILDFISKLLF
ncbi:MAG: hypothetical protein IJZ79_05750 [Bacilli bacterium]|nr:hypothetical protein [Bacilli bacterium]